MKITNIVKQFVKLEGKVLYCCGPKVVVDRVVLVVLVVVVNVVVLLALIVSSSLSLFQQTCL